MATEKEIVVSGIRPTGYLHLGNYFGAIRNYVRMQEEFNCYFFVADWHSLTTHPDPKDLPGNVMRVLAENIASGLDPEKVSLYVQSDIPEIAELYLLMNMLAYVGELEKVPTFKDKVRLQPQNVNAGLLTYPVLMSVDILIQRAVKVPVGKDQGQHLEMARNFAQRFNARYGDLFPEPVAFNYGDNLIRIQSLDGKGKMSKSENEFATLYLADEDQLIREKLKKAKTDSGTGVIGSPMPESVANLLDLMKLVSTPDVVQFYENAWNNQTIRFKDMKEQLGEDMVKFIAPIREKAKDLQNNTDYLKKVIKAGAEKARANAAQTLQEARRLIGIKYY
ncbi:tryptophanyl-tRNA synthetase [Chitinophaga terrae (ex Kim and Jung 2007)]|uniref:Tryptophan--tRNA ligase n=1 Tax=Chitinophaga terrae (ex Kim and Jung 2007) TaxID=408074 RepID=A0A1H4A525_9BACT|nr:tryptophan--tRNA ligase [Chitinophaga terrae (ex Kim and Jung 2007)]GEP90057.1 tryptophan--tRNA ligase [Chitinophaga terrae (ex Kim and Jung 2007)]SEA31203.1 tryptophanyl-tRNA synthetase [Chitinophaga terrae (ex Kim and Jung 2007)]